MKAVNIILAIILTIILFAAEALTMGLFAVNKAASEDSVRGALDESGVVEQLVDEAISEGTVNMGGEYGEMMQAVFRTEPVKDFFAVYVSAAVNTQLFGDEYEEIADDDLMRAFSDGIDEVNETGAYEITPLEGELLRQAMQREIPDLTATLNSQVSRYDTLDGDVSNAALNSYGENTFIMSDAARALSMAVCVVIAAAVAALCWRSRLGFLWCAVTMALASLIYMGLAVLMSAVTMPSATDQMACIMAENGFGAVWPVGMIIAAVFLAAFIILRVSAGRRKSTQNENVFNI